jgi:phosphate-selective porin OprO and OprP
MGPSGSHEHIRQRTRFLQLALLMAFVAGQTTPRAWGNDPFVSRSGTGRLNLAGDQESNVQFGTDFPDFEVSPETLDQFQQFDPHSSQDCPHIRIWRPTTETNWRLRGRIDTDFIWPVQSAANQAVFGDLSNTVGFRRARIGVEGNWAPDARYVAEIDLASGEVVLRDVYFGIGVVQETGEFKFGHMREPFSLEGGTSANSFAFMERSSINDLDPARNWGAEYTRCGPAEDFTTSIGVYQAGTDPSDLQFGPGSETALTAKWTWLPWYEDHGERLMHCGLVVSPRYADFGVVILKQKPSSPLLDLGDSSNSPFVPTIRIPANFQQSFNAQWALVYGSFWAQAEWYGSLIEQRGGPPVFYHGAYLDVGYFLTGEHRRYLTKAGVFGPVIVNHPVFRGFASHEHEEALGCGAWELTGRISYLDYFDVNAPPDSLGNPVGTILPQATIGANWYLADRLRLLFNYTYSVPDVADSGATSAHVFATRLGVFW